MKRIHMPLKTNDISIFSKSVSDINESTRLHYESFHSIGRQWISDGIVDVHEYFNAPVKILWILKEPYCDGNNGGGGWSLSHGLKERAQGNKKDSIGTWHPIVYVSHGILNGFKEYSSMPRIQDEKNMEMILNKIAVINLQKFPSKPRTDNASFRHDIQAFDQLKIVAKQIEAFQPDIVIGASTLNLLRKELKISKVNELPYGHFTKDKILFINTMHPAQTRVSRSEYIDKIILRAREWEKYYR